MPATVIGAFRICLAGLFLAGIGFGLGYGAAAEDKVSGDRESILVIDGDTLEVAGRIIQLAGIDAPEIGQVCVHGDQDWHCGLRAAYALHKFIELAADPVVCSRLNRDGGRHPGRNMRSRRGEPGPDHAARWLCRRPAGRRLFLPGNREEGPSPPGSACGPAGSCFPGSGAPASGCRRRLPGPIAPARSWVRSRRRAKSSTTSRPIPSSTQVRDDRADVVREFCSDEEARAAGWRRPGEVTDGS